MMVLLKVQLKKDSCKTSDGIYFDISNLKAMAVVRIVLKIAGADLNIGKASCNFKILKSHY